MYSRNRIAAFLLGALNMLKKSVNFLKEVKLEMKKVSWSTKNELITATVVTFVFVAILAAYIYMIDFIMSRLTTLLLK